MMGHLLDEHEWGLLAVAVLICLFATTLSLELAKRSRAGGGNVAWSWVYAAGLVAGSGVWTMHFVAMLAWRPGIQVAYAPLPTAFSIVIAVTGAILCFWIATVSARRGQILAGVLLGLVVGAMHYTGMAGLRSQGTPSWDLNLVAATLVLGSGFGAMSLRCATGPEPPHQIAGAAAFVLAVVTVHFGGMAALHLDTDRLTGPPPSGLDVTVLVAAIVTVMTVILATASIRIRVDNRRMAHSLAQAAALEQRNRELELADLAKSRFVAGISHEIRTPLNAVLGFTELLASSPLNESQARHVAVIRDTGRLLLTLLDDILDLAKLEAGRLELERIDFSLAETLGQVRSLLAPQATERGLKLLVSTTAAAELALRGDPIRLRQVLINLVGNGLKFTTHGEVVLTAHVLAAAGPGLRLRFEVRDTGIGIPHEQHGLLFQAFVQADSSITRKYGGSGLGLAISRSLVEAMGGVIGLESEPGRGSLFWFELPFEAGCPAAVRTGTVAPLQVRPLRVLAVDDVAVNRELLSEMLGGQGHVVMTAADGAEAVALVARECPDVVLMDVQMPVMDGVEATRQIRRLPEPAASVPILALTANAMASERNHYLASGMNRCLTKPIDWPDLFAALAEVAKTTPTAPATRSVPAPPASLPPVLDLGMLSGMAGQLPAPVLQQLLGRGLSGAAESCQRLCAAEGDQERQRQEAHRLRGTAGSFGLARISALAGKIEDRLERNEGVTDLLADLDEAVSVTRVALAEYEVAARAVPVSPP